MAYRQIFRNHEQVLRQANQVFYILMERSFILKILVLFSSGELGGAERSLTRMATISSENCFSFATCGDRSEWSIWLDSIGKDHVVFGEHRFKGSMVSFPVTLWKLLGHLRDERYDCVYVCGFRVSLALRFLRFLMPRKTKIVHAVRWNPASDSFLDYFFRAVEKRTAKLIDYWITNSKETKNTLVGKCGVLDSNVSCIYNGVSCGEICYNRKNSDKVVFLTVANISPRKGIVEFLKVANAVIKSNSEAHFIFVGRDMLGGEVQAEIARLGIEDNIEYVGFQDDVSIWYQSADVFVLPSLWGEGCPTSILEALSFGIPVVAYEIDGIPELIQNNIDGFCVDAHDELKMAASIRLLLQNKELRQEMGIQGALKVRKQFSIEKCYSEHQDIFLKLSNR